MVSPQNKPFRRTLYWMLTLCLVLVGALGAVSTFGSGSWTPKLGLDLEGGTQMILQPQVREGEGVEQQHLDQAVDIMRARVDGQGVAEAEVSTLGDNVVVSVPGVMTKEQEDALRQSSQMRFRPVLLEVPAEAPAQGAPTPAPSGKPSAAPSGKPSAAPSGKPSAAPSGKPSAKASAPATPAAGGSVAPGPGRGAVAAPSPSPTATPAPKPSPGAGLPKGAPTPPPAPDGTPTITPADAQDAKKLIQYATSQKWITPALQAKLAALDCRKQPLYDPSKEDVLKPYVACSTEGHAKYLLGPAVLSGQDIANASSGPSTNQQGQATGGYEVNLQTSGEATPRYATISGFMVGLERPRNQLGAVLDGKVISAPFFQGAITGGQASITGNFTAESAKLLADQLKFGALPISFSVQSTDQISPTVGEDQLSKGLIAGLIGLLLVVVYTLVQYRALGFVTVASLVLVAGLTFVLLSLFGWAYNLRLTMAGVTGAIVAIGTTADSFIVYFERVRDEVREGRRLDAAVQTGWDRAKRTILISDGVNFLAAVVLYLLAASNVRGFAFMLMLTTVLDLVVTFMFTHPLLSILSRTSFFGGGHKWSGFDPATLGATVRYAGAGRVTIADRRRGVGAGEGSPA